MSGSTSQILCGAHGFQKTSPTAINNDCIMECRSRDVSKANGVLAECWKTLAETESERQKNRRRKRGKREKDGKRERERERESSRQRRRPCLIITPPGTKEQLARLRDIKVVPVLNTVHAERKSYQVEFLCSKCNYTQQQSNADTLGLKSSNIQAINSSGTFIAREFKSSQQLYSRRKLNAKHHIPNAQHYNLRESRTSWDCGNRRRDIQTTPKSKQV